MNDVSAIKECLVKTRQELVIAKRISILNINKIDFARKVTEQRMSNCLSNLSDDLEEELVSLYSTLVDEENFNVEEDKISPQGNFLQDVEEKFVLRGDIPSERSRLDQVKNKILDRVNQKKTVRQQGRERRNSISSVGSTASKRGSVDQAGADQSRVKVDTAPPVLPPSKS